MNQEATRVLQWYRKFYSCTSSDCKCEYKDICDLIKTERELKLNEAVRLAIKALEVATVSKVRREMNGQVSRPRKKEASNV